MKPIRVPGESPWLQQSFGAGAHFNWARLVFGVLNKNIQFSAILLKDYIKIYDIGKDLRDLTVNNREALLYNIIRDAIGMSTSHKQIIGCKLLTNIL